MAVSLAFSLLVRCLLLVLCWFVVGSVLVCCWFCVGLLLVFCWFVVGSLFVVSSLFVVGLLLIKFFFFPCCSFFVQSLVPFFICVFVFSLTFVHSFVCSPNPFTTITQSPP